MTTASQQLLDLVRTSNGECTDYRASKLMGVSTSAVSRWRLGQSHMSETNVLMACKLLGGRPDVGRWQILVGAEREQGPDGDYYRVMRDGFETVERGGTLPDSHPLKIFIDGLRGRVAGWLLGAVMAAGMIFAPAGNQAHASASVNGEYTLCEVRRRARRWLKFFTIFPVMVMGGANLPHDR